VVAATSLLGDTPAVTKGGSQSYSDSWTTTDWNDRSEQHVGSVDSLELLESGCTVRDFHATSLRVCHL